MAIRQLILVKAAGSRCSIYCFERRIFGGYVRVMPVIKGYVGRGGVTRKKREGDFKTPAGLYAIGFAFGKDRRIKTRLDYRQITSDSRWCSNPKGAYNRWTNKRWEQNCEDMWKYHREYRYGAVVEYNREGKPGLGSAIFLHCKQEPTAGCVAAGQEDIKRILRWLDRRRNPHIFIREQM